MIYNKHFLMDTFGSEGGDGGGGNPAPEGAAPEAPNVNGSQDFKWPDNWKDQLPEELKSDRSLEAIADIPSLAKSYVHAQKMVGANKATVPDPKLATDDDWRQFFQKAGLPEKAEEYKIEVENPDDLPENFLENYQQKAHELNILPHQAKQLLEWYKGFETDYVQGLTEQQQAEMEKNLEGYRQVTGQAYEKKIAYANKVVDEFGSPELSQLLLDTGLAKNPEIIKLFSGLGEKMFGEDVILGDSNKQSALTPEEASSKWNAIRGDKEHPYWKANHPSHQEAIREVSKLMQYIHGNS